MNRYRLTRTIVQTIELDADTAHQANATFAQVVWASGLEPDAMRGFQSLKQRESVSHAVEVGT